MASVNKVILIGNLGHDPESINTASGSTITKFSIATTDVWNDKATGEKKEKTEWHRIVTFSKLAETCARYLTKGKQVYIEGKLQTSSYEKDGVTHYATDIIAEKIQFLGSKGQDGQTGYQDNGQTGGYQHGQGQPQGQGYNQPGYSGPPQQNRQQPRQNNQNQGRQMNQQNFGGNDWPESDQIPF